MPKWQSTKFPGVRYREHPTRKHGIQHDKYFTIRFRVDGRNLEEGLGWASAGWAQAKAAARLSELREAHRTGDGPKTLKAKREQEKAREEAEAAERAREEAENVCFDALWQKYLGWAKDNKRFWKDDKYRYESHIKPVFGTTPIKKITPFTIEKLKKGLTGKGLAPGTVRHVLALIRQIINKAIAWGDWSGSNPIKKVKFPRAPGGKLRTITPEEEERLFKILQGRSPDVHDQALVALYAGLWFEEVASMRWSDVDLNSRLLIVRGKGGKIRTVPLCDKLIEMFKARAFDKSSELVFPNRKGQVAGKISHSYYRSVNEAGLNSEESDRRFKVDFHTLRHTFATRLASNGTPLTVLRDLLGHRDLTMVSRYAHVIHGQAAAAVAALDEIKPTTVEEEQDAGEKSKIKGAWESGDNEVFSSWSADLIFSYPDELEENLATVREWATPDFVGRYPSPMHFLIEKLEDEAKEFLAKSGYPVDLNELWYIESNQLTYEVASARAVLFAARELRDSLENGDTEQSAICTLHLVSAAIRTQVFSPMFDEIRRVKGRARGGRAPKKLVGVVAFINKALADDKNLTAKEIWRKLKLEVPTGFDPLKIDGVEIYIDHDEENPSSGEHFVQLDPDGKERVLTFPSFQRYVSEIKNQ